MYQTASGAMPPWQSGGTYGQPNSNPAYISVNARNSYPSHQPLPPPPPHPSYMPRPLPSHAQLQHTPPSSTISNSSSTPELGSNQSRKKIDWPQPVREYVNRCFAADNQILGIERSAMEARLKQLITDAAQTNTLATLDWSSMPLPQQTLQAERAQAALGSQALPTNYVPPPPPFPLTFNQPHDGSLRKRKSSDLTVVDDTKATQPPWKTAKQGLPLEDRIDKRQKLDSVQSSKSSVSLEQRKRRFEDARAGSHSPRKTHVRPSSPAAQEIVGPVVGRSEKLEKNYFRLTSAPNPNDVRPLPILRQTLELLKKKWRQESNYVYICDQFKSLRQDLTVQHIKNDFTTSVYEIHARIALEKGDLGEYNQCQTQLKALYKQHLGGHSTEFKAYRILYFIHTCNRTDMNDVLSDLTQTEKDSTSVKHALEVRSALALGNYHKFFKLYLDPPNMGAYLMDMFIERERLGALAKMAKTYKPDLKLRFITEELAFESDEEAAQFILDHDGKDLLHEKDDEVRVSTGKAGRLFEDARSAAFSRVDIKGQI